ncbi:hypothetical protein D3C75_1188550 [compost metagenome]
MAFIAHGSDLLELIAVPRFNQGQMDRPFDRLGHIMMQKQQLLQRHFQLVQNQNQLVVPGEILPPLKT